jgi:hypothetical protein
MPTLIDKYTARAQGFELCVVPLQPKPRTVEVFGTEIGIPSGRGYAIFLCRETAVVSVLVEQPHVKHAGDLVKRLVYAVNRRLNGVPEAPKKGSDEGWDNFKPRYDDFSAQWEESRTRVDEWWRIVASMLTEALAVLED